MANVRLPASTRNAMVDAVTAKIDAASGSPNAGRIQIFSGTQPASGGGALSGNTLLAELPFSDPAFGSGSSGVATANSIASQNALATGTAAWARIVDGDGNCVFDCDVGTSGATVNLVSVSITSGQPVQISSATLTQPAS